MKTSIVSLVIGLLMIHTLTGQVKIGDNPQNLDPASVLELESTSKALVIPRLTDAQMNAITPLRGALVYNTDQDCIHYFDGVQWVNICEALDNSFTVSTRADFLSQINPNARDSTVVITPTLNPDGSTNYNFEVNQITGANIAPSAINGDKIQNGTVGSLDLAEGSVTLPKLADAENGVPGDIIQWDGFNWVLVNENILGITEVDGIVGNEVVGSTDGTLVLNGGGSGTDPYTLDVAPLGIDTAELADNAVNSIKIQDGQVATLDLADNAVTNIKMADNSVGTAELIDDSVDADKINANVAGTGLQQAGDGSLQVDNANIAPDWTSITNVPVGFADNTDENTTNTSLTQDGTNLILTDSDTNTVTIPLSDIDTNTNTINVSLTQDGTNLILTDSDTNTVTIPLSDIDTNTNTINVSLTQDGTNLILTDSDTNTVTIPLSDINTNTTNVSLTQDGTNLILTDSDTNTVSIPLSDINSDTNTTNVSLTQDGTNLILTDSDTNTVTIPLSDIDTDTNTTNSSLTQDGTNLILTDSDTNTVTIPLSDIDTDTNTTNSSLTQDGTNLILTDSDTNTVTIPLSDIDTDTNTTNSSLTQDGTNLILTDSDTNTVTIPLSDINNQVIVSAEANNSITASGTDGGAFYDDSALQTSIAANTTAIGTNTSAISANTSAISSIISPVVGGKISATGTTPLSNLNITTVTHTNGTGIYTINFLDLGTTNYVVNTSVESNGSNDVIINIINSTSTSLTVEIKEISTVVSPYADNNGDTVNIPTTQINPIDKNWSFTIYNP